MSDVIIQQNDTFCQALDGKLPSKQNDSLKNDCATSSGSLKQASTPVNGDAGSGGGPWTTIAGGLIGVGGTAEDLSSPSPCYVQECDLQGTSGTNELKTTTIVDGKKLQHLLRPKHRYFENKLGSIASFSIYEDPVEGKRLLYAQAKAMDRANPYRRMQLRRQSSGRSCKAMFQIIDSNRLDDFRIGDLTLTFASEISEYLSAKGKRGREYAWRMEVRFWDDLEQEGLASPGRAKSANLHTWKTSKPTQPHYHFHLLVPNYVLADVPGILDDDDDEVEVCKLQRQAWDTGRGGSGGMWSKTELDRVKAVWLRVQLDFARKHNIDVELWSKKLRSFSHRRGLRGLCRLVTLTRLWNTQRGFVDVNVAFLVLNENMGRVRFLHKLNYKSRHWTEDFAKYSNADPDCEDPPSWLEGYENRARVFGWWANLKAMAGKVAREDKLSPYNSNPMTYVGSYTGDTGFDAMLEHTSGRLQWVEFIRGRPVEGEYTEEDIAWLRDVCMTRDGYYDMKWHHRYPSKKVDLQGTLGVKTSALPSTPEDLLVVHSGGVTS